MGKAAFKKLGKEMLENSIKLQAKLCNLSRNIIDIPKGIGQVINPDRSIIEATKAIVVKNADGATNILTTAYPKIIP